MTAPDFAMVTESQFRRLSAADQDGIFWAAFATEPCATDSNRNADTRWACVKKAKDSYWAGRQAGSASQIMPAPKHEGGSVAGRISAAECNEWLRSLPRLSPDGEI